MIYAVISNELKLIDIGFLTGIAKDAGSVYKTYFIESLIKKDLYSMYPFYIIFHPMEGDWEPGNDPHMLRSTPFPIWTCLRDLLELKWNIERLMT